MGKTITVHKFGGSCLRDISDLNRIAEVIATPIVYNGPIKPGDKLLVHHNVFKFYNDMYGNRKSGKSFFKDDLFFIDNDQFFLYKHNNVWNAHSKYCMIKPIKKEQTYLKSHENEEPLIGLVKYPNKYLISKGVNKGDKVSFKPNSEYEFNVDGEKLYRMFDHQVTLLL